MQELVTYEHLRELQHFARLGRMSASLLHEISNPLAAAMLNLEVSDKQSAGVRRAHRDMKLMRRYIEAARQQVRLQGRSTSFAVRPQLDQLKHVVVPLARKAGVQLNIGTVPDCHLYGDPVKFQHVISNLIVNAIESYGSECAMRDQFRPVKVIFRHDQSWLIIQVKDRGKGITPEALPQLFKAFYTTKEQAGRGLGIGLNIVEQYVKTDFGGSIEVISSSQNGTCFTVKLPTKRSTV